MTKKRKERTVTTTSECGRREELKMRNSCIHHNNAKNFNALPKKSSAKAKGEAVLTIGVLGKMKRKENRLYR